MVQARHLSAVCCCLFILSTFINFSTCERCHFRYSDCTANQTEIYRDTLPDGRTKFRCCPNANTDEITEDKEKAALCEPSDCVRVQQGGGDLCSSFGTRKVAETGRMFNFVEAIRDSCTLPQDGSTLGVEALCCGNGTLELGLTTLLGVEPHEFPHFARVEKRQPKGVAICGGTIYNERYIITASHCVVDKENLRADSVEKFTVFLDIAISGSNSPHKYGVESITVHPNASLLKEKKDRPSLNYDIALVRLDRDIEFSERIQALPLAPKDFDPKEFDNTAVIVGFGDTDTLKSSKKLHKGDSYIRNATYTLSQSFGGHKDDEQQLLFLGGYQHGIPSISASGGDSGGPAVCRDNINGFASLCGLTSFGSGNKDNCEAKKTEKECQPTAYVKISFFREWIEQEAKGQENAKVMNQSLYGKDVEYEAHPSQVEVRSGEGDSASFCGGTLISKGVVVTAAHCVVNDDGSEKDKVMVTKKISGKGRRERVKSIQVMEGFKRIGKQQNDRAKRIAKFATKATWDAPYYQNDLALVKLHKPLNVDEEDLPSIPEDSAKPVEATEVAWVKGSPDKRRNGKLTERTFELMTKAECQKRMDRLQYAGVNIKVDQNIVCGVERYSGGSKCDRSLGGALLCNGGKELCGVQVFRFCQFAIPGAFMDVGMNSDWIKSAMKKL